MDGKMGFFRIVLIFSEKMGEKQGKVIQIPNSFLRNFGNFQFKKTQKIKCLYFKSMS